MTYRCDQPDYLVFQRREARLTAWPAPHRKRIIFGFGERQRGEGECKRHNRTGPEAMQSPYSRVLGDLLLEQAERYGDRPAVIAASGVLSYRDLADRAARVAAGLRERGIGRGDRVALLINNRPE